MITRRRRSIGRKRLLGPDGRPIVRARYDVAQTTNDNTRHWANTDSLAADAAHSSGVRQKIRDRARYEVANNSYAKGLVVTLANDSIGTGPRLQMLTGNPVLNRTIEEAFAEWANAIDLAGKLRTMRMAKATDGEAFGILINNPVLETPAKLDLRLVETECVQSPTFALGSSDTDGLVIDAFGNVITYYVLRNHPGGSGGGTKQFDPYAAKSVVHWLRVDRPGQHRGVPEITQALPLYAQLRRYTLAVLAAAETAADYAAVIYTDTPADESEQPTTMDTFELEKRMATVLPDGWRLGQVDAKQPATTYAEFKREILNEIARCLSVPYNVAAGNSSGYNYASGRLDFQTYFKSIRVEQSSLSGSVLGRLFAAWIGEMKLLSDFAVLRHIETLPHQWFFDGTEHVDPMKEAKAQETRLTNHTTTLAIEFARSGRDWETELRQIAKERELMQELGLTPAAKKGATNAPEDEDAEEDEEEADAPRNRGE
ncbi:MAG: phage portal protein [Planctomycetes bacterium]|nr:phage portal protein [Planctomycetota bacterium]